MNLGGRDFKCRDEGEGVSYEASRLWNPRPKTDLAPRAVSGESKSFYFLFGHKNWKYSIWPVLQMTKEADMNLDHWNAMHVLLHISDKCDVPYYHMYTVAKPTPMPLFCI